MPGRQLPINNKMIKAKTILLGEDDEDDVVLFREVTKEINNSLNIYQAKKWSRCSS